MVALEWRRSVAEPVRRRSPAVPGECVQGLESEETAFDGRSDYEAFVFADIPAGGLFSGAEVLKTEEQEEIYGGVAGTQRGAATAAPLSYPP